MTRRYVGTRALPIPADFKARAKAAKNADLCERYGVSEATIRKWRKQAKIPGTAKGPPLKPREPMATFPDFLVRVRTMNYVQLARHYKVGKDTIRRMCKREGVTPAVVRTPRPRKERAPRDTYAWPKARRTFNYAGPRGAMHGAPLRRDSSLEGRAADVLRRLTFVFRCGESGAADQAGDFWRYGNVVLTGPELVERARRHGFDPDEWARLSTLQHECRA